MSVILHAFLQRGETRSLVSLLPFGISNKVESRGFDYSLTQIKKQGEIHKEIYFFISQIFSLGKVYETQKDIEIYRLN